MPRHPRLILPGFPHHVTHRGNRRQDTFREEPDYGFYFNRLVHYAERYAVRIYSYCLMRNHIHLVPVPGNQKGLSQCMHDLQSVYTAYFNRKYDLSGHLWQERFFCSPLDDLHLWNAVRYVERNPVRAGLATRAEDYRWSSAQARCGIRKDRLLDPMFPPAGLVPDWSNWLAQGLSPAELKDIRTTTRKGVPYATQSFTQELESLLGVTLTPGKRGRPKKAD